MKSRPNNRVTSPPPRARGPAGGIGLAVLLLASRVLAAGPGLESAVLSHTQLDFTVTNGATARPAMAVEKEASYRLGIGDILSISVYGEDKSERRVPVDPSGRITYPLVNTIQASGRTIDELRTDLQDRISKELRHGLVTVIPVHFGSRSFTVLGLVEQPGTYPIEGCMTIMDALAKAKGLRSGFYRNSTADFFDLRHATLLRHGVAAPVDFEALVMRGDMSQNLELVAGDIITIPSALIRNVYVLGEVVYPRSIGFMTSLSLLQVVTEVRGLKSTSSGKMVVVRGSTTKPEVIVVDVRRMLAGKAMDIQICPGDIIYAPRASFEIIPDIVKAAISGFAGTVAADSGSMSYLKLRGESGTPSSTTVVP